METAAGTWREVELLYTYQLSLGCACKPLAAGGICTARAGPLTPHTVFTTPAPSRFGVVMTCCMAAKATGVICLNSLSAAQEPKTHGCTRLPAPPWRMSVVSHHTSHS